MLCRAALPVEPVQRALDIGCGAGTGALVLARRAARAVGPDSCERAIVLSRINAAINGITNIEFRVGDLFAPVAGETFDLVISQPPFVPMPQGAGGATWLYGGHRGDELPLRLLSELEPYLAPKGRAVLIVEWGDDGTEPIDARVRAAISGPAHDADDPRARRSRWGAPTPARAAQPPLGPGAGEPDHPLDDNAVGYAATLHPRLDADFDAEVRLRRDHLETLGIRGLTLTLTIVQREVGFGAGWTNLLPVGPIGSVSFTSSRIDKLIAARGVASAPQRLLSAALRVPAGTVFAEEQDGPGADVQSRIEARPSREALIHPASLTPEGLGLLTFVHEAPNVRTGLERFAAALQEPVQEVMNKHLMTVRASLLAGLLEIESPRAAAPEVSRPVARGL